MNKIMLYALSVALVMNVHHANAQQNKSKSGSSAKSSQKQSSGQTKEDRSGSHHAFLGVMVTALPPVLRSQMPDVLSDGQGVLVVRVEPNSPAAKAGIEANDVLLSVDNQKLSSPEQLIKLIHDAKPGHQTTVETIRGGKNKTEHVTLGEMSTFHQEPGNAPSASEDHPWKLMMIPGTTDDRAMWESFTAMNLTKEDNNKWKAEIEYLADNGKKVRKTFEGSREDIRHAVQSEKDMPANERQHVMRMLNMPVSEMSLPGFPERIFRDFP